MQVTLGNAIVASVVLLVGGIFRVIADAIGKAILYELRSVNQRMSWIDGLMKRYPDPMALIEKLAKLNGHKDTESITTTKETSFK